MKPLRTNAPLKSKMPLRSVKPLKRSSKPKKIKQPVISKLRKSADSYFSRYIRLRDSDLIEGQYWTKCISCDNRYQVAYIDEKNLKKIRFTKYVDNGHFISRGNYYLRYNEQNCNAQCKKCNKWLNGNLVAYRKAIDLKFGDGTADQLTILALEHEGSSLSTQNLLDIIKTSREQIQFYEQRILNNEPS